MNQMSKLEEISSSEEMAKRLRVELSSPEEQYENRKTKRPPDVILIFAYNRTGKTRLTMDFKDQGKLKSKSDADTLYYNAFTEDLFVWNNDLSGDVDRRLMMNTKSNFSVGEAI
jgi:hypothetical protein